MDGGRPTVKTLPRPNPDAQGAMVHGPWCGKLRMPRESEVVRFSAGGPVSLGVEPRGPELSHESYVIRNATFTAGKSWSKIKR